MINAAFLFLCGLGIFMVGLKLFSTDSNFLLGNKLNKLFKNPKCGKFSCLIIGTAVSAICQSSGAVTAISVCLVDTGILSLVQSAAIVMGANVGTTITAQLLALSTLKGGSMHFELILGSLSLIGAIVTVFAKKEAGKKIGFLTAGFGMIFIGLHLIGESMTFLSENKTIIDFLATIKNDYLLIFIGILLTAIMQSSSGLTGIIIAMLPLGILTVDQAIMLTFGSNIGSCTVALIAGFGTNETAKISSRFNMIFNVLGVIIFMIISNVLKIFGTSFGTAIGTVFKTPQIALSMMHTLFNVVSVIILYPFTNAIISLCEFPKRKKFAKRLKVSQ